MIIIDPATSMRTDVSAPAAAIASLDLPHGATLTSIRAQVQTTGTFNSAPAPMLLRLVRKPFGTGAASNIASWASLGVTNTTELASTTVFTLPVVDRAGFAYPLAVQFPSLAGTFLFSVSITYTLP